VVLLFIYFVIISLWEVKFNGQFNGHGVRQSFYGLGKIIKVRVGQTTKPEWRKRRKVFTLFCLAHKILHIISRTCVSEKQVKSILRFSMKMARGKKMTITNVIS